MSKVNIVVPIYRDYLEPFEVISLNQLSKQLGQYPITIIHPHKVNPSFLKDHGFQFQTMSFADEFFNGIYGYNKLMLSLDFYKSFDKYEFILIHQTDVYVFKDDLIKWCNKNFDYVGSPWIAREQTNIQNFIFLLNNFIRKKLNKKIKNRDHLFKVGNGGFSLRKVDKFIDICRNESDYIQNNIVRTPSDFIPEDIFWSLYAYNLDNSFLIPDYKTALEFGFDRRPHIAYKLNNNKLPFGVHGLNKKNKILFYQKLMKM